MKILMTVTRNGSVMMAHVLLFAVFFMLSVSSKAQFIIKTILLPAQKSNYSNFNQEIAEEKIWNA